MPKTALTIADVRNMNEDQLAAVRRQGAINIAKFIAIKIGIAVAVHVAVKALVNSIDDENE